MALPEATAAYEDCYEYYERAQSSTKGIRIATPTRESAFHLRARLNMARALERRDSMRTYDRTDPRYGKSVNDKYRVTMLPAAEGETGWWVYIEEWRADFGEVEELE